MTHNFQLLDNPQAEEHFVLLYGQDDRLLTLKVSRYMAEGLRRGDGLLVIALPEHRSSIEAELRAESAYSKAILEGRLVYLDAAATLDRFMVDGEPDAPRFEAVIGQALRAVRSRAVQGGVRAYGEMVGILWQAGQKEAAIRLEELWNQLLRKSDATLFCGYPIDVLGPDFHHSSVDPLLCAHTHLLSPDAGLEDALQRAMDEVLGARVESLRPLIQANHRPAWADIARPEALILWLRNNLPGSAERILARAREIVKQEA
jgi:MEDS: MEthanogen/methylotroph, DcmR Sensory domain